MFKASKSSLAVDIPEDVKLVEEKLKINLNFMKKYKSIIFDCDGVILNSNKIKTASFKKF